MSEHINKDGAKIIYKMLTGCESERDHYKALMEYLKSRCVASEKVSNAFFFPEQRDMPLPEFDNLINDWQEIKKAEPK